MNFKLGDLELLFENIECIINSIENEELTEEVIQHRENRDAIIKLLKPSE